jgi:hypothetical protein
VGVYSSLEKEVNRDEYDAHHVRCPKCLSDNVQQTTAGPIEIPGQPYEDNTNRATCQEVGCDWSGKVSGLQPRNMLIINRMIDDETGESYKETNLKKTHKIPVGTLVELLPRSHEEHGGVRLYVVHHMRDCDGTPLYAMSATKSDTVPEREGFANRKWEHGWTEESLMVCDS